MQDIKSCKAAGVDKLSGRFFKDGTNISVKPVSALHKISIFQWVFPNACKVAKIKPILNKNDQSNYRLISLFLAISKIIDKIVHD